MAIDKEKMLRYAVVSLNRRKALYQEFINFSYGNENVYQKVLKTIPSRLYIKKKDKAKQFCELWLKRFDQIKENLINNFN